MIDVGAKVVMTEQYIDAEYLLPLGRDSVYRANVACGTVMGYHRSEYGLTVADVQWDKGRELHRGQPITTIHPTCLKEMS